MAWTSGYRDISLAPNEGVEGLVFELGLFEPAEWDAFQEYLSLAVDKAGLEHSVTDVDGNVIEGVDVRNVLMAWAAETYHVVVS